PRHPRGRGGGMQPASNSRRWLGGAIALVGGAVTAVGAFLPWVSVHLGQLAGNRSLTVKGTSSTDGKVALAAGIVLLIAGAAMWAATPSARRGLAVLAIVAGLVGGGIALFDVTTKDRQFDDGLRKGFANVQGHPISNAQLAVIKEQLKRLGVSFSLSSGLYIALVGGVIGLIGGIVGLTTPAPAAEPTDLGFGTGGGCGAQ